MAAKRTNAPYATATNATLVIPERLRRRMRALTRSSSPTPPHRHQHERVTLTVTPLTPPTLSDLVVLGDGNLVNATGGNGQNYRVWASTNVALTPITSTGRF